MTTVLKDGEVDKLVMEWLKKRKYVEGRPRTLSPLHPALQH